MPKIAANGVELFYDDHGATDAPVILLIMGLATQMIAWPQAFIDTLTAAGFRVIRYDNRDIGLSAHLDDAPSPSLVWTVLAKRLGLPVSLGYSLTDMAHDAIGLLDALGIPSAHIVGASMGGMISQLVAVEAPSRVRTLTSIMSTSGARGLPGPSPALRKRLMQRPAPNPTRAQAVASAAETLSLISYPDPARPWGAFQSMAEAAYDRSYHPAGAKRQLLAIIADGSRADRLRKIQAPTLVIHGAADPLVPLAGSRDIVRHVPNARLEVVEHMAHDLPPSQIARLAELISEHAASG